MQITPLESWIARKLGAPQPPGAPQPLSAARLREYQLAGLRETLAYAAARSRFYRRHLAGLDPASIRSMEDVARIPCTTPDMLAENPMDFLCVAPGDIGRIVTLATSGTTGRSKRLFFTPEDQELTIDFFHHGMTTFAASADRVLIFMPGHADGSVGDLLRKALARFGSEGIVFGPIADYEEALRALQEASAECAVGIPSQMLALARHGASQASAGKLRLRSVLLSADYVPQAVVEALEQEWGCEVYGHYGMTEMGLGGGVECRARSGYHLRDSDLLFEIVDPANGAPVSEGAYGEVVFSTLTRRGMPLLRYRTGDRSRFLPSPCPCGSMLRRMERVSGRLHASIALKGGISISIAALDEILLRDPGLLAYQAEMHRRAGCDCLVVKVRTAKGAGSRQRLYAALSRTQSLGPLLQAGLLALDICEDAVEFFTTGTRKRGIVDLRNP